MEPSLISQFDEQVITPVRRFVSISSKVSAEVAELGTLVNAAFTEQKSFLNTAVQSPKPSDGQLLQMLHPTSDRINAILTFRNSKRSSAFFNHLSTVSESIAALGWVSVEPAPSPFIKEMEEASQFYSNRVLKDYKDRDAVHAQWVRAWNEVLTSLYDYVKTNHTTGLTWNVVKGGRASVGGAPQAAGGPPPPPPSLDSFMSSLDQDSQKTLAMDDMRNALFSEINKGADITKGLKKVTADMQTHKNPALRREPVAAVHVPEAKSVAAAKMPLKKTAPPVIRCDGGKKWIIENQVSNQNAVVQIEDMKQVVYVYNCVDTLVQLKGKANSVTVDNCKRFSIVFDNLVSSIEVINCQKVQIQTLGTMPTVTIQNTDGCQIYLSKQALNAEIVTSRSSEMNVLVPDASGEFQEFNIPEQFKSVWNGKKLETVPTDLS